MVTLVIRYISAGVDVNLKHLLSWTYIGINAIFGAQEAYRTRTGRSDDLGVITPGPILGGVMKEWEDEATAEGKDWRQGFLTGPGYYAETRSPRNHAALIIFQY